MIVGGGVIGASVAYHLAKLGWRDVLLLEQNQIAAGTSWHAAGLIGRLRTTNSMTKINKYSAELYAGLEAETGHPIGWKQVGSLVLGKSERRIVRAAPHHGRDYGRRGAPDRPAQGLRQVAASSATTIFSARSGCRTTASSFPRSWRLRWPRARAGTAHGARRVCAWPRMVRERGRAVGVRTPQGDIRADYVVLCGGMWSRQLAQGCGVSLPLYPVEHHYVVTEPLPGAFDELPVGRDPPVPVLSRRGRCGDAGRVPGALKALVAARAERFRVSA